MRASKFYATLSASALCCDRRYYGRIFFNGNFNMFHWLEWRVFDNFAILVCFLYGIFFIKVYYQVLMFTLTAIHTALSIIHHETLIKDFNNKRNLLLFQTLGFVHSMMSGRSLQCMPGRNSSYHGCSRMSET